VSDEGEVFTWGWGGSFFGGNGGLGHGDNVTQPYPALVEALSPQGASGGAKIQSVSVGATHMLALCRAGGVWSWGNGEYGRCGNGKTKQLVPEPVDILAGTACTQVSAGTSHSLAVTSAGALMAWGKNDASQLGLGGTMVMDLNTMEAYPTPVELDGEDGRGFSELRPTKKQTSGRAGWRGDNPATTFGVSFGGGRYTFLTGVLSFPPLLPFPCCRRQGRPRGGRDEPHRRRDTRRVRVAVGRPHLHPADAEAHRLHARH
jgi:hypothetical protein